MLPLLRSMRRRHLIAFVPCAVLGALGMRGTRVPLLGGVDLGFHELGHMISYALPVSELVQAGAGSFLQVAVPLVVGLYFLMLQGDRVGASICLAWAATSTADVARYVADAPTGALPLIGGEHDWAFILGADGLDTMTRAASLAATVDRSAWLLFVAALVVALWPGRHRRRGRNRGRHAGRVQPVALTPMANRGIVNHRPVI